MNFFSLVFALFALGCFLLDFFWGARPEPVRARSLTALGLAFLTASWMAQLLIEAKDLIHI